MGALSAIRLLELWNSDQAQSAHWRLEPLVAAIHADEDVAGDTLGRRNQRLLELHRSLTVRPMAARSRCTACATDNEFPIPVVGILACPTPTSSARVELRSEGKRLRFRVPTMRDLRLVHGLTAGAGAKTLAAGCLVGGDARRIDKRVIARLDARLEKLDPAARIVIELGCAECSAKLRVLVDVAELVAPAIDSLVEKAIREVHVLAGTYGWSERDILDLPEERRRRYLALIAASPAHAVRMRSVQP